eukprot:gene18174-24606_t
MALWLLSECLNWQKSGSGGQAELEGGDVEKVPLTSETPTSSEAVPNRQGKSEGNTKPSEYSEDPSATTKVTSARSNQSIMGDSMHSGLIRAEFGTLMLWYYVCDRTKLFSGAEKHTEEWKGWVQVLFLLYHYFEAKEAYNAIRLFIAGYVWMTGYGNFMYYYKTGDYCIGRFSQMMWRLNFLVFFACIVLNNSYMLYYICPMHTIFTILVYATLGLGAEWNQFKWAIWVKMLLAVFFVMVFWDMKMVFYFIWSPFKFLVGYLDPRKLGSDDLYEWYFRSSLDRFVWIYGMICAFVHPQATALLTAIDNMPPMKRYTVRSLVLAVTGAVGYYWFVHVYCLPKLEYNAIHPYTSWIPITLWIIVRNMTPTLRLNSLRMFGWLGCITLETYISQFHIWLSSDIPDGQPKSVLSLAPGYPLINFALCTAAYIFVSHRLFELTNTLKNAAVPHSNNRLLARNVILLAGVGIMFYSTTAGVMTMLE